MIILFFLLIYKAFSAIIDGKKRDPLGASTGQGYCVLIWGSSMKKSRLKVIYKGNGGNEKNSAVLLRRPYICRYINFKFYDKDILWNVWCTKKSNHTERKSPRL